MNVREMRNLLGVTQNEFAYRYQIPFRTLQNWETGKRIPPKYIIDFLDNNVKRDLVNRKTYILPKYDPKKQNLPRRSDFIGHISWIHAVKDALGENVVFALDDALILNDLFGGYSDEYIIWVYGKDSLSRFNGVVVLGNEISKYQIENRDGISFTNINRTINDALANENILDMQGVYEALNKYYFQHNNSFKGICVSPEHQKKFERIADDAIKYYDE